MYGKLMLTGALAAGVWSAGCATPAQPSAAKQPPVANQSKTLTAVEAPPAAATPPMKHRKLVFDEKGNAYQMLDQDEGMCDSCDI
ncbi:hypothetical protein FACS1894139_07100 [Planctomycetales bacterium]|nr:hypothetical protein FACS1894107_04960 [Planctomycetales bacterium]GHT04634.1 hypothetical protein FACS1894139_07100 [Planctomycetales bacterium]GHV18395.1 hypothetical protein AGMMS49959_00040 [Planctomycetales bacterium]